MIGRRELRVPAGQAEARDHQGGSGHGLVAGVGFRRGAVAAEIVALVHKALISAGASPDRLRVLATAADRADEPAIRAAAAAFGLVPTPVAPEQLVAVDAWVPTRSARIVSSRGVGSLAEAAALALAGAGGRLVVARIASAGATCALAIRAGSVTRGG